MLFKQLSIQPFIHEALRKLHFSSLTPVQEEVIPRALKGESLVVQSQTGTGKTHAFMIPIMNQIKADRQEVQAVITAPSRELAAQLYDVAVQLVEDSPAAIQIMACIGGSDKQRQLDRLTNQQPHVVIGTPGRIFDLMKENALWVQTAHCMVIDEADMTLDMGFLTLVDEIASRLPADLQMMAFSATFPQSLIQFLNKYMSQPEIIKIDSNRILVDQVENYLINTKGRDRKELVYQLLTLGHPFLAVVFCNTRHYADQMTEYLREKGLKVAKVHGGLDARERKRIMKQIKQLDFQYVVASDLAARGIDIPGISMVINTELPKDLEFFVHRVGRTARSNIAGTAYTFVQPDDDERLSQLEAKGIEFREVTLVNGEIKEIEQRYRRTQRSDHHRQEIDHTVKGMIHRSKKSKVKPGYKKQLKENIRSYQKQQSRRRAKNRRS